MRINEKHLAAFANGTAPLDREGYLYKRGEVNKAFHKRWFVLKGNLLFYYEKKSDKEPIGVIVLEGCTVELSEVNDSFAFELVFEGSGSRTYVLSADTQKDMEDWMKAIACAGYDYMKLMVTELQRQMDDLTADKTPIPGSSPQVPRARPSNINGSQELLVDLSTEDLPPPVPPRQATSRHNPFNVTDVDQFGAQPFNPTSPTKTRNFLQMHRDFGAYINKQMTDAGSNS